jgi:hypothetical protein
MPISYLLTTPVVGLPYDLPSLFAYPPVSVGQLFRQLSFGELHDMKVGLDGIGSLKPERYNQIIHLANEGLRKLHQKFELISSTEEITVPVSDNTLVVPINALAIQVVSILPLTGGSLTFMTHPVPGEIYVYNRKIYFPPTTCEYKVQVLYQKRHPTIREYTIASDLEQPIYLSVEMWAALRAYIAGEVYGNMNTADAKNSAAQYRARYKEICTEVESTGGIAQGMLDNNTFDRRGFR